VVLVDVTSEQVGAWAEELAVLTGDLGHLFARPEPREVFADLMEGLLSDLSRKNGWTMAERAGHATPHRIQKFLGEASWDAEELLSQLRMYVAGHLGDAAATLVLDDTQAQKKGTKSVGVARQHCGVTGDVRNCHRRLYLPHEWADDPERRREAGVPDTVAFATKPQLAIQMLQRALSDGVLFAWAAGDSGYGRDPSLRDFCHRERLSYVLGVAVDLPLDGPPGKPAPGQPQVKRADHLLHYATSRDQWERRSCGEGSKGQRYYDWTVFEVEVTGQDAAKGFEHHLLIRRSTEKKRLAGGRIDYEYAYFLAHAPAGTPAADLIVQAGVRWKIEENNEDGKQLVGLDQYQVRKWTSWHRHITCAMLAQAFLVVQRAEHPEPQSTPDTPAGTPLQDPGKAWPATEGTAAR